LEAVQGKSWSNKDLFDYLEGKGLKYKVVVLGAFDPLPVLKFQQGASTDWESSGMMSAQNSQKPFWDLPVGKMDEDAPFLGTGAVFFGRAKSTAKVAEWRRRVAEDFMIREVAIHTWGRFAFYGDPDEIAKIKKAL
jgi:hypothetical protein